MLEPEPREVRMQAAVETGRHRKTCKRNWHLGLAVGVVALIDVGVSGALLKAGHQAFFIMGALRVAVLAICAVVAVRCGAGDCPCGSCFSSRTHSPTPHSSSDIGSSMQIPLASLEQSSDADAASDELAAWREANTARKENRWKTKAILALCFVGVTACSVYTGTIIAQAPNSEMMVAWLLTVSVFCMNLEFGLTKLLVDKFTRDEGVFFPALHEHELHYMPQVSAIMCGSCRERIGQKTGGREGFTCKDCEGGKKAAFTICLLCYRRKMAQEDITEGILRGDKGPKTMPELTSWGYMKRSLKLAAPFKLNFVVAISCVLITQAAKVATPNYQGTLINTLIDKRYEDFHDTLAVFTILSVTSALFNTLKSLAVTFVSKQIIVGVRRDMFRSIVGQDMAFFDGIMSGQLTSRMQGDAASVTTPIQQVMSVFLANLLSLIGGFVMCFFTSWKLTMLALTFVGPVIYITGTYARWSKEINRTVRQVMGDANATATESFRNIRTVRSFGAGEVEASVYDSHMDTAWKNMRMDCFASAGVDAISGYVDFSASVLVYWYGGNAVINGTDSQLSIGNLVTFNLYWNMLRNSIKGLNGMLNQLIVAASAAKRVFEVIDLEPDIKINDPEALQLGDALPAGQVPTLEFRNVVFTYQMRPDQKVFAGLSFTLPAGSTTAFVGKSGCGKSSAISLLLRFYDPQEGAIFLEGRPLTAYNLCSYQQRVGVVSQETQIFARSIRDNMTYGLPPEAYDDARIEAAARQANAHDFILKTERGYDSMLGENGCRLSGGQKQRLSIARAFLRRPQLLILDEATSALDSENEKQIQQALDDMVAAMAGSCSIVMIAHRLSTVIGVDKIVVFEGGQVHEEGNHEQLMEKGGSYASLVNQQMAFAKEASESVEGGTQNLKGKDKEKNRASGKGRGKGKLKENGGDLLRDD